jgi:hypothetical protein
VAGEVTDSVLAGASESAQLRQEYAAFQQVKAIRHPFLLSLERVELVDGELVMVMELADRQLGDRFAECRAGGLPGVPRDELLGYLREAAEALDVISAKYGLQHLDVKPGNLFLTGGHVQVGDYGLVSRLDSKNGGDTRGLTPRYAAPEVLRGQIHTRSDQYSLALVYFELLTGAFPYTARNPQLLMMQHLSADPDLSALPESDRAPVATALAKQPEARFDSCSTFVRALAGAARAAGLLVAAGQRPVAPASPAATPLPGATVRPPGSATGSPTRGPGSADDTTRQDVSFHTPVAPPRPSFATPSAALTPPPVEQMASRSTPPGVVRLAQIHSLVPVAWLKGQEGEPAGRPAAHVVRAVVSAAETDAGDRFVLGSVTRGADGAWGCRFLTTIDPRVARVKLDLLWEQGGVTMDSRTEGRVVFRKPVPPTVVGGLFGFGKKAKESDSGLEVVVDLPDPKSGTGEVTVRGTFFGAPPEDFVKSGEKIIVRLLDGIRKTLNNVEERRKHPRIPATFPVTLYPLHSDGRVDAPIRGYCQDVSAGGLALFCTSKPHAKYAYVSFDEVPGVTGVAVLLQFIRIEWVNDEVLVSGRYRLDIGPDAQ